MSTSPTSSSAARRHLTTLLALLASFALVAAACGDDADEAVDDAIADAEDAVEDATGEDVDGDAAQDAADDAVTYGQDLAAQVDDADLTSLYSAMDLAGFDDIAEAEAFTFFAPNDSAFTALDPDDLAALLADPEMVRGVLRNHMLDATVMAADIPASATSVGGLELTFDTSGDTPTVNGIPIIRTDVSVDNGVVHVIDGVLLADG